MSEGRCLCGSIRWRYTGAFSNMTHCHCQMCRKAHGAPFATYLIGSPEHFAMLQGAEDTARFESSSGFIRSFCRHCGSVLPNTDLGDFVAIPAGGMSDPLGIEPQAHIFARWKAPWHEVTDDLPQHDNYPGAADPAVARDTAVPSTDGKLRGSCLCGEVGYDVSGGFLSVYNCHCSRCRYGRAAAHTTNGFLESKNIQFTRGSDQLTIHHVESAQYHEQVFCARCGSCLPHIDTDRGLAAVPFGSLDDDPKCGADSHIFVGSKSAWYPITDGIAQFDEMAD